MGKGGEVGKYNFLARGSCCRLYLHRLFDMLVFCFPTTRNQESEDAHLPQKPACWDFLAGAAYMLIHPSPLIILGLKPTKQTSCHLQSISYVAAAITTSFPTAFPPKHQISRVC